MKALERKSKVVRENERRESRKREERGHVR